MIMIYQFFGRECLPFQGEGESLIRLDGAGFRQNTFSSSYSSTCEAEKYIKGLIS